MIYKSLFTLVELKLKVNKAEDAKYFTNVIINNFDDELTKLMEKFPLLKVYKISKRLSKSN